MTHDRQWTYYPSSVDMIGDRLEGRGDVVAAEHFSMHRIHN